jgi:hypothetical protein
MKVLSLFQKDQVLQLTALPKKEKSAHPTKVKAAPKAVDKAQSHLEEARAKFLTWRGEGENIKPMREGDQYRTLAEEVKKQAAHCARKEMTVHLQTF